MPQKRSAYKELRKAKKRHARNVRVISEIRTLVKKFNILVEEQKLDQAKEFLKAVSSKMDKAVSKGIIRKNTASRKISNLSKNLQKSASSKK